MENTPLSFSLQDFLHRKVYTAVSLSMLVLEGLMGL